MAMDMLARREILAIADAVAQEKGIDREEVIQALELALQKIAKMRYGAESTILATISRKTGEISLMHQREIVEKVEDPKTQISLEEALRKDPEAQLEGIYEELLPPVDFGRISVQVAKQLISQRIHEVEREHQYERFKERIGEIISGAVKRVELGNVTVDLGSAEGFLRRDQLILKETFKPGDRIRAYVKDVRREPRGHQIFLSRTDPGFLMGLFAQEVPEVYNNLVQIKGVARDPGSRAKMAVFTSESSIDPVGTCVGVRGSRVQAVIQELQGEKIDIIRWSPDLPTFVVNALAPAEALKVIVGRSENRLEVVVPDDQLSLAIGRRGQNVRLASELTGTFIDVLTESEESNRRNMEFQERSRLFAEALDIDEVMAQLLASEGFESIKDIAYVDPSEFYGIQGFTEEIAAELQARALLFLEKEIQVNLDRFHAMGGDKILPELDGMSPELLMCLLENGIKAVSDLADLSVEELQDILRGKGFPQEGLGPLIMAARARAY